MNQIISPSLACAARSDRVCVCVCVWLLVCVLVWVLVCVALGGERTARLSGSPQNVGWNFLEKYFHLQFSDYLSKNPT